MSTPSPTADVFRRAQGLGADLKQVAAQQSRVFRSDLSELFGFAVRGIGISLAAGALIVLGVPLALASAIVVVAQYLHLSLAATLLVMGLGCSVAGIALSIQLCRAARRGRWFERSVTELQKNLACFRATSADAGTAPDGSTRLP